MKRFRFVFWFAVARLGRSIMQGAAKRAMRCDDRLLIFARYSADHREIAEQVRRAIEQHAGGVN
jgi:hypothetical protein